MNPRGWIVWKLDTYMASEVTKSKLLFTHVKMLRSIRVK